MAGFVKNAVVSNLVLVLLISFAGCSNNAVCFTNWKEIVVWHIME